VLESGQVVNADDETVGYIDLGKATLRDASESFLASVTGVCVLYYSILIQSENEIEQFLWIFINIFVTQSL
jgi:hypothetical protein